VFVDSDGSVYLEWKQTRKPAVRIGDWAVLLTVVGLTAALGRLSLTWFRVDQTQRVNNPIRMEAKSADQLLPVVYEELRRLAAHKLANEAPGQTLQPTALVHEAWIRLAGQEGAAWNNRDHFFAAAAEAMRRILVDNARRKQSLKRGGAYQRVDLTHLEAAICEDDETILAVSEALDRLAAEDPQCAELIKLRFFAGMPNIEAAKVLGMAERTAKRTWAYARARLYQELMKAS
jgi:RNA polymerase sigma factor (TIGR02999 family)